MMKHSLLLACCFFTLSLMAERSEVLLVGHRGSNVGVENTMDAFRYGATRGYTALETDLHMTKDGHFVCSHDADLKVWGYPKVVIEKTTLKKLQKLTLKQKRWGVDYTGHITTFEEYLDFCAESNIIPVIEFKFTTGVTGQDTFNVPKALDLVRERGLLEKAVFISFMKAPLQYIREHESPDLNVQFLCMPHNERQYFEWMKQYHIDLDICQGFSREMVERYHAAGLKVNCWTIDHPAVASEVVDFGVDFLTTNCLTQSAVSREPFVHPAQPTAQSSPSHLDTTFCVLPSGDTTGVCIYLPAGYDDDKTSFPILYPTLYLLHGSGDDETGWADRGQAKQILDSLIMSGLCRPMVVVMPNGYMETYTISQNIDNLPERKAKRDWMDGRFEEMFPYIVEWAETWYRLSHEKQYRAIAGLSMGGFHTFHIAHSMPYSFDYVAPFSALYIPRHPQVVPDRTLDIPSLGRYQVPVYRDTEKQLAEQFVHAPRLYWIACGEKDYLYDENVAVRQYFNEQKYPYVYHESAGGHSWVNWRNYLRQLLPMLF